MQGLGISASSLKLWDDIVCFELHHIEDALPMELYEMLDETLNYFVEAVRLSETEGNILMAAISTAEKRTRVDYCTLYVYDDTFGWEMCEKHASHSLESELLFFKDFE